MCHWSHCWRATMRVSSPSPSWCWLSVLLRNTNKTGFLLRDTKSVSVDSVRLHKFTANREALCLFGCASHRTITGTFHISCLSCVWQAHWNLLLLTRSFQRDNWGNIWLGFYFFWRMSSSVNLGMDNTLSTMHLCYCEHCTNSTPDFCGCIVLKDSVKAVMNCTIVIQMLVLLWLIEKRSFVTQMFKTVEWHQCVYTHLKFFFCHKKSGDAIFLLH